MAASNHSATEETKKRHKHEGPQKHIVAYIFSLLLTLIAFAAVMAGEVNTSFIIFILLMMAGLQVFVQMGFWMHMKDRGHLYPIIGILTGVVVVFTMVIMAEYWAWW
ncbi:MULTISPECIES: cytochrome C oxidase subunit IV family protein [Paenibacillus]|uniref:Cytochrome C oxidase subunit IV n=1 Tax=Paenibacillus curdlanolyticus YK9 TaxID=717606 RepID=E0I7U5_9BACL|nr:MULTISPECIES: cytochrome C oxidase subunit IV family protein [Paenibacillus]EFM11250.1 cytochrome C oxidase subunit IV [Paenibacillus curdlanolyticus YK9]MWC30368.1 cytochrome C oxidase subunit IV [Paenibacillus sp. MMS18-CY102]